MKRRSFLWSTGVGALAGCAGLRNGKPPAERPNILFAISDDQSWAHTGAMGDPVVKTPTFDRVAGQGVLFRHAFCSSPSCTPSRGATLTGQDFWRLEEGADLWSTLPAKFAVYPELLAEAGYHVGHTRKGWGPGKLEPGGRSVNPAGPGHRDFSRFLDTVSEGSPFCFWFGSVDPHRPYKKGSGAASGKDPDAVVVPPFLPDTPEVRNDILDYYVEVERFDREVGEMLALIEARDQLENTLVVITSDNGMPFPRAKTNLYDYGCRMPLAICWPEAVPGGRVVDDFVSHTDFAPTFLEAAGLEPLPEMTGSSLLDILTSGKSGRIERSRDAAFFGRERHCFLGKEGIGYPCRAIRTHKYLYIRNFDPDRWPAGPAPVYRDIDSSPTKTLVVDRRDEAAIREFFNLAAGKRPAEELYNVEKDPGQIRNLATDPAHADDRKRLATRLEAYLRKTGDPRITGRGDRFDQYPYYGNKTAKPG